jgi:diguanylate cyclase (GGDEF)-like protein/PAS domain S-box-containing protein
MELLNQLFYLFYGLIVLMIFLGAFSGKNLKAMQSQYLYWPIALVLMVISSFSFFLAGLSPSYFLSLANTALIFSGVATVLFIASWRNPIYLPRLRNFWLVFVIFFGVYELFRIFATFDARVYLVTALIVGLNAWGLIEVQIQSKREKSAQLWVLRAAFCLQLGLLAFRIYASSQITSSSASTIYQENSLPAILRVMGIASNLLVYIAVGNILLERLWKKEARKSSNAEMNMLSSLNALALARDNETGSHIIRTQEYVKCLAERLRDQDAYTDELSDKAITSLYKAAPLHDVGKVGIPDHILHKEGSLSRDEWGIMKTHTTIGEYILSSAKSQLDVDMDVDVDVDDVIEVAIKIAASHHERWDGQGYPKGLKGPDIPLPARIMALADMYDALVSERVYKKEWTHQDAINEILDKKGKHFDPVVVDAFIAVNAQFYEIAQQHKDGQSEIKILNQSGQSIEHKLRRSEEKLQVLFDYSPIGMVMIDHGTGEFLEVNSALLQYTGYTKEEFLKLSFWNITPPEYANQEQSQIEELNCTGSFGPNQKEYIRKDGTRFPISLRGFMLNDVDGRKLVWGIIEDISAKQQVQQQDTARNLVLEMLAKDVPPETVLLQIISDVEKSQPGVYCSILVLDPDKAHFSVAAAPRIPSCLNEVVDSLVVGHGVVSCGDAVATGQNSFANNMETHPNWEWARDLVEKSGFKSCWSHPVFSSKGDIQGTFASYRCEHHTPTPEEITAIDMAANLVSIVLERKQLTEQIQHLALYDFLTGLPNRYLLIDRIRTAMSVSKRSMRYGALLFMDLDSLKELNDEYGHPVGDLLLIETAKRLQLCVRDSDTVARFGGDEFVIVLSNLDADREQSLVQMTIVVKKILASLAVKYEIPVEGRFIEYFSTVSVGCKLFIDEQESPDDILKLADMSMYRAKKSGGNQMNIFD